MCPQEDSRCLDWILSSLIIIIYYRKTVYDSCQDCQGNVSYNPSREFLA